MEKWDRSDKIFVAFLLGFFLTLGGIGALQYVSDQNRNETMIKCTEKTNEAYVKCAEIFSAALK